MPNPELAGSTAFQAALQDYGAPAEGADTARGVEQDARSRDGAPSLVPAAGPAGQQTQQQALAASTYAIIESHGDAVLALPPGSTCLASSPTAAYEAWALGPNVLAVQVGRCGGCGDGALPVRARATASPSPLAGSR